MFKSVVIFIFISSFIGAVSLYLGKSNSLIRDNLKKSVELPRMAVTNFVLRKYSGNKMYAKASGSKAFLMSTDRILCIQKCRYEKHTEKKDIKNLQANRAEIFFDSNGRLDKVDNVEVDIARLTKKVVVDYEGKIISTEEAIYNAKEESLSSQLMTKVDSLSANFQSDGGFLADLNKDHVEFFGNVTGSFKDKGQVK